MLKLSIASILAVFLAGCSDNNETIMLAGLVMSNNSSAVSECTDEYECPIDGCERDVLLDQSPHTVRKIERGGQLDVEDIRRMTMAGMDASTIIGQIECTDTKFHLTPDDIISLQNMGVSQKVIDFMIRTGA